MDTWNILSSNFLIFISLENVEDIPRLITD